MPDNVRHFDTPFLTDIAHNADPSPQDMDHNPATPPVAPVPDDNTTASADFASQPPGTYDDEMLNDHFACGDGRCNENIALSTIHQIFHSEHDRLVGDIEHTLSLPTTQHSTPRSTTRTPISRRTTPTGRSATATACSRQRGSSPRWSTSTWCSRSSRARCCRRSSRSTCTRPDINPAIHAEFAHAVYRFGHSMLDDDVARTNADGSDNSLPLLDGVPQPAGVLRRR